MRVFIEHLEEQASDPEFFQAIPLPSGLTATIGRAFPRAGIPSAVTDTLFDMMLGITPEQDPVEIAELLSPVDCARKLREWFELPSP